MLGFYENIGSNHTADTEVWQKMFVAQLSSNAEIWVCRFMIDIWQDTRLNSQVAICRTCSQTTEYM